MPAPVPARLAPRSRAASPFTRQERAGGMEVGGQLILEHPVTGDMVLADVEGTVDWDNGCIRLAGAVRRVPLDGAGHAPGAPCGAARVLTHRELQVARLLALGESNVGIAAALGISPHTARRHTEGVMMKLGVRSRAQVGAVLLAFASR